MFFFLFCHMNLWSIFKIILERHLKLPYLTTFEIALSNDFSHKTDVHASTWILSIVVFFRCIEICSANIEGRLHYIEPPVKSIIISCKGKKLNPSPTAIKWILVWKSSNQQQKKEHLHSVKLDSLDWFWNLERAELGGEKLTN